MFLLLRDISCLLLSSAAFQHCSVLQGASFLVNLFPAAAQETCAVPVPDCQVHLRICSHYNNKSRSQEQHSQVGVMILQDHALGISPRVS